MEQETRQSLGQTAPQPNTVADLNFAARPKEDLWRDYRRLEKPMKADKLIKNGGASLVSKNNWRCRSEDGVFVLSHQSWAPVLQSVGVDETSPPPPALFCYFCVTNLPPEASWEVAGCPLAPPP